MTTIAWIFWTGVLASVSLLFWWLWRLAERIEREEIEEQAWIGWLEQQWTINPQEAQYWENVFQERFMK